jgi:hypothetical protein
MEFELKKCKFIYDPQKLCFFIENHKGDNPLRLYPRDAKILLNFLPAMQLALIEEQNEADRIHQKAFEMKDIMDVSGMEKLLEDKTFCTKTLTTSKDGHFSLRLYLSLFNRYTYLWLKLYVFKEESGQLEPAKGGVMFTKDDNLTDLKSFIYKNIPKEDKKPYHA